MNMMKNGKITKIWLDDISSETTDGQQGISGRSSQSILSSLKSQLKYRLSEVGEVVEVNLERSQKSLTSPALGSFKLKAEGLTNFMLPPAAMST